MRCIPTCSYSYGCTALSQYLPPPRWKLGAAQRSCNSSFLFCISVIDQKTSLHIAPTQTRDILWCPVLTQPHYHNFTLVYLGVLNGCPQCTKLCRWDHNICRRWFAFVLPSLNPIQEWLHRTGQKGGSALKVRCSIFGNKEIFHLCVQ